MATKEKQSDEFARFDNVMNKILTVSHEELKKREEEWKRGRAKKKRTKKSASRAAGASRRDNA